MKLFTRNCTYVLNWLKSRGCSKKYIEAHERVYEALRCYAASMQIAEFTRDLPGKWLESSDATAIGVPGHERAICLERLTEVYENGVLPASLHEISSTMLSGTMTELVNAYCKEKNFSAKHAKTTRIWCKEFLQYVLEESADSLDSLSYESVLAYHDRICAAYAKSTASMTLSAVKGFLQYAADQGKCSVGMGWFLKHIHSSRDLAHCVESIASGAGVPSVTTVHRNEILPAIARIDEELCAAGYSRNVVSRTRRILQLYFIHLEAHQLHHTPELGEEWRHYMKPYMTRDLYGTVYRALQMLECILSTGACEFKRMYRTRPGIPDAMPSWCEEAICGFLDQRAKAKLRPRTLEMDRAACVRFCQFLGQCGLERFDQLTPEHVKAFNFQDVHTSPEGKGTYNTRIRHFLEYLFRSERISSVYLADALPTVAAPAEDLVITLSDTERQQIADFIRTSSTPIELRDAAMLLIGTELGIRGIDIVQLKRHDIDWKQGTIRFLQQKTGRELLLPLPVSVGNAIFRYMRDGRPRNSDAEELFLTTRAPWKGLNQSACARALRHALPERDVPGSGFHVTRKSFASIRLNAGAEEAGIADVLGHSNTRALRPYLSLDRQHMLECPLGLSELNILYNPEVRS